VAEIGRCCPLAPANRWLVDTGAAGCPGYTVQSELPARARIFSLVQLGVQMSVQNQPSASSVNTADKEALCGDQVVP
jgi:hypothetical protein